MKAHTIQRNGGLSRIAVAGHVYSFRHPDAVLVKTGQLAATQVGIHQASTFTGFCRKHDDATFRPLEDSPFEGSPEQAFLLAYRALTRGLFYKRAHLENLAGLRAMDRGSPPPVQAFLQCMVSGAESGARAALMELEHHKALYDKVLLSRDYGQVRYYIITTHGTPEIAASGMFQPEYDWQGRHLQDMSDLITLADHTALSLVPTDSGGAVVFSWVGDSAANARLAESLHALPDDGVADAIIRLSVEYLENVFMAPTWWEPLPDEVKARFVERARSGTPMCERHSDCLLDDGLHVATWAVESRITNAF